MNIIEIVLIALGLSMDAFAVSIAGGIAIKMLRMRHAVQIAAFFGVFQALMPVVGWFAGLSLRDFVSAFDHWIAFGLLTIIGCKMIYESFKIGKTEKAVNYLNIYILFILSIATSIDALAVGFSFAFLNVSIVTPVIVIGVITFVLSFLGVVVGNRFGHIFESKIEIVGGLVLIVIGFKILVEHLGYL